MSGKYAPSQEWLDKDKIKQFKTIYKKWKKEGMGQREAYESEGLKTSSFQYLYSAVKKWKPELLEGEPIKHEKTVVNVRHLPAEKKYKPKLIKNTVNFAGTNTPCFVIVTDINNIGDVMRGLK